MNLRELPLGGAVIALAGDVPDLASERLAPFARGVAPTLTLTLRRRATPAPLVEAQTDILGIWRRKLDGRTERVDVFVRGWSTHTSALTAVVEGDAGTVDLHPDAPEELVAMSIVDILLQVLAVERLSSAGGLLLHASAVRANGSITLFAGDSGMGKSTAAGHCARAGAVRVCEDRTAIELAPDGVRAWPTPFQGRDLRPDGPGPLRAVHLLARAEAPRLEQLSTMAAAQGLLANAFSPLWDRALLNRSLAAAVELTTRVPVSRLHLRNHADFVPLALEDRHAAA